MKWSSPIQLHSSILCKPKMYKCSHICKRTLAAVKTRDKHQKMLSWSPMWFIALHVLTNTTMLCLYTLAYIPETHTNLIGGQQGQERKTMNKRKKSTLFTLSWEFKKKSLKQAWMKVSFSKYCLVFGCKDQKYCNLSHNSWSGIFLTIKSP